MIGLVLGFFAGFLVYEIGMTNATAMSPMGFIISCIGAGVGYVAYKEISSTKDESNNEKSVK